MARSSPRAIMSPEEAEEGRKALGFPESGSIAPMEANRGKWHHGISADKLERLSEIRDQILSTIDDAVVTVARARLSIGSRLNEARELFPGDLEFGRWRKDLLPDLAPRTCTAYMAMAREFKNAPQLVEAMGWTVARELISAPPEVKDEVKSKVQAGETVTKDEIKSKKAKPTSDPQPLGTQKAAPPPPEMIDSSAKRKKSLDQRMVEFLDKPAALRLMEVKDEFPEVDEFSQAALSFGFAPGVLDLKPNLNVWLAVYDYIKGDVVEDLHPILDSCYSTLRGYWG